MTLSPGLLEAWVDQGEKALEVSPGRRAQPVQHGLPPVLLHLGMWVIPHGAPGLPALL